METTLIGGFYRGLYGDNGKENGNSGLIEFRVLGLWGMENVFLRSPSFRKNKKHYKEPFSN